MADNWLLPDTFDPPSKDDIPKVKMVLENLEIRLKEARLSNVEETITKLEKTLTRYKDWIAPVRRIPLEILSMIFVEATRVDWKMPFILGNVHSVWRLSILGTPQVWSMVNLNKIQPGSPVDSVVERSDPFPLKLIITEDRDAHLASLIESHTNRIRYLEVRPTLFTTPTRSLSNLTTLVVLNPRTHAYKLDPQVFLDGRWFPKLRCLHSGLNFDRIGGDFVLPTLVPPIEEIALTTRKPRVATVILERLAHRLVVLYMVSLIPTHAYASNPVNIVFPRLHTLSIITPLPNLCPWPFEAQTPVLYTYRQGPPRPEQGNSHRDTKTVKRLCFGGNIDLRLFPEIREVRAAPKGAEELLDFLNVKPTAFPELDIITCKREGNIEEKIRVFNHEYGRNITPDLIEEHVAYLASPYLEWAKWV